MKNIYRQHSTKYEEQRAEPAKKKLPPIPKSFEEINLNDQWTKTSNNKDFLLHQGMLMIC